MLRIKEYIYFPSEDGKTINRRKVDLKELEKFGFEKDKNTYYFKNVCNAIVLMVFDNRKISNPEDDQGNEVLYDLIQAGLVEKVEEER